MGVEQRKRGEMRIDEIYELIGRSNSKLQRSVGQYSSSTNRQAAEESKEKNPTWITSIFLPLSTLATDFTLTILFGRTARSKHPCWMAEFWSHSLSTLGWLGRESGQRFSMNSSELGKLESVWIFLNPTSRTVTSRIQLGNWWPSRAEDSRCDLVLLWRPWDLPFQWQCHRMEVSIVMGVPP